MSIKQSSPEYQRQVMATNPQWWVVSTTAGPTRTVTAVEWNELMNMPGMYALPVSFNPSGAGVGISAVPAEVYRLQALVPPAIGSVLPAGAVQLATHR